MAISAKTTNKNIEAIGSIKVISSSSPNINQQSGLIFGGYGYSADIQANNGDGYSITIKVISKDGKYLINSTDLSVKKDGAKNIIIGNFTFYDFYLVTYSIDKEVENSILTLTYKDKSIFMDKVFIGLFGYHYGNAFDTNGKFIDKPGILNSEQTVATFKYKCNDSETGIKDAFLRRFLNRAKTLNATTTLFNKNKTKFPSLTINTFPDFLSSDAFFSRYYYNTFGVNGGYIILGREEINEENCDLPEVSYCFKDLTSALAYSDIPGIVDFNLGNDNEIYRILRRKYFGSLRSVLDQWGGDFGFKFYFQPKIDFYTKDYSNNNSSPVKISIPEAVKLIDLASTSTTLKNLNSLFNDPALQKVIESLSETATLEGTRKTNVITPIRREARSFPSSVVNNYTKTAQVLNMNFLPSFYGNNPADDKTIIGGVLSIYDSSLRDLYHLAIGNYKALGISNSINLLEDRNIVNSLDLLLLFGSDYTGASETLDNYFVLLTDYDEGRHSVIKEWEKSIMSEYYGQYYMVQSGNKDSNYCDGLTNFSITYTTSPQSESYVGNQLPFAKLLYGQFGSTQDGQNSSIIPKEFGKQRYNPIFKGENPFDSRNEKNYADFAASANYESGKGLTIINLKDNPRAKIALYKCFTEIGYNTLITAINSGKFCLVVGKKLTSPTSKISSINISGEGVFTDNLSVSLLNDQPTTSKGEASSCTTFCEQTLAEQICGDQNASNNTSSNIGFVTRQARYVTITKTGGGSCNLILPATSNYQYIETQNTNSTRTLAGISYVIGSPPIYENDNVMSYEVIDNTVPEILTQSTTSTGVVDQIITFDNSGKNNRVLSAKDYHDRVSKNLNNSVPDAFEQRKVSLTSTYIPSQLVKHIFNSPILNSINFSFNESGFNTTLDFSSRPKQPKQKDSLFLTERFLRKL